MQLYELYGLHSAQQPQIAQQHWHACGLHVFVYAMVFFHLDGSHMFWGRSTFYNKLHKILYGLMAARAPSSCPLVRDWNLHYPIWRILGSSLITLYLEFLCWPALHSNQQSIDRVLVSIQPTALPKILPCLSLPEQSHINPGSWLMVWAAVWWEHLPKCSKNLLIRHSD